MIYYSILRYRKEIRDGFKRRLRRGGFRVFKPSIEADRERKRRAKQQKYLKRSKEKKRYRDWKEFYATMGWAR